MNRFIMFFVLFFSVTTLYAAPSPHDLQSITPNSLRSALRTIALV